MYVQAVRQVAVDDFPLSLTTAPPTARDKADNTRQGQQRLD